MRNYTRDISTRMVLAGTLIAASFFSAYFISASANRSSLYWGARTNLLAGNLVKPNDFQALSITLNAGGTKYVRAGTPIIGSLVVRSVLKGEILPASSLTPNSAVFKFVSLPISVQKSDLPKSLLEGEKVDVYHVGDPNSINTVIFPTLVLAKVIVLGIDKSGSNMGGSQTLTVSAREGDVIPTLNATSTGRLVIVRVNG